MPRTRRGPASISGPVLLGAMIVVLPLVRGGVDLPAQVAATILSCLALWLARRGEAQIPWAGLALLGILLLLVIQVVPWPTALHRAVPEIRSVFEATLRPLGRYPEARAPSLDPAATGRELAKAVVGLATFLVAWLASAGRRRRGIILVAVAGAGLGTAFFYMAAALLNGQLLAVRHPFVNPNHAAGLLGLTCFVMLGLALRSRAQAKLLWLLAFAGSVAVLFATLSRGGIGAFFGGAVLFALLSLRRGQRKEEALLSSRIAFAGAIAGALALAAFVAVDPVISEFRTIKSASEEVKVSLWRPALTMALQHPLLGVGRGAFEVAFPSYKTDPLPLTFTHLENEWLQPLVELGIPAGLLLIGTLALAWGRAAARRELTWTDIGLLAGTATLAAHNAVDFSLELLGVSVPFMAALGLAARGGGAVRVSASLLFALPVTLFLAGASGLAYWGTNRPERDLAALESAGDADAVVVAARAAAVRRPADYFPHAFAGARLVEEDRCAEALPWLTRAMLLNPTAPEGHLFTARCLAASGQGRAARREYRLAWSFGQTGVLLEAARRFSDLKDLLEVTPDSPEHLMSLGEFLLSRSPSDAAATYRRVLEEYADGRALVPLARALRASNDLEGALALVRRRSRETPSDAAAWRLSAEILVAMGQDEAGEQEARRGLAVLPGSLPIQGFLVERSMARQRFSEAQRLADEITARTPEESALKHLAVARALAAQGRIGEAINRAQAAVAATPLAPSVHVAFATICERAGRFGEAAAALERAAGIPGQQPEAYADRIRTLRAAEVAQADRRRLQGLEQAP